MADLWLFLRFLIKVPVEVKFLKLFCLFFLKKVQLCKVEFMMYHKNMCGLAWYNKCKSAISACWGLKWSLRGSFARLCAGVI
jgi:hypothetical protein